MSNAAPGKTLKYGETTTLRFEIPASWDLDNLTEIAVSVTDESGTVLDTGDAVLWTASELDTAAAAYSTSIVLASGASDLAPGDTIRIGDINEIEREIRDVIAYDKTTRTVLIEELNHAHVDTAAVVPMWCTYDLDLSDTTVFPKGIKLSVRWNPDTSDGEWVQSFIVGVTQFASQALWEEFSCLYETEWERIQNRDLALFERMARRAMKRELIDPKMGTGRDLDKIQDMDLIQEGLLLRCRLLALSGVSGVDEYEQKRARDDWDSWLASINALPIWEDDDQDAVVGVDEVRVALTFRETARYS